MTSRRLFAVLQILLLGASVLVYSMLVQSTAGDVQRFDYFSLHASAQRADRGWDPYGPVYVVQASPEGNVLGVRHDNLNPPVFIGALIPLSRLPVEKGYLVFTAITLILALAAVPFLVTAMPEGTSRARAAMDVALLLALSFPVFLSVRLGQVGHALLLPVAAAWWALRNNRDRWAGCALGIALAFKVFFGLFLVMFLLARRWKAAAVMVLVSVAVSAVGAVPLGWHAFGDYANSLASVDWYSSPWNASLLGLMMRIFVWSEVAAIPAVAGGTLWAIAIALLLFAMAVTVWRLPASPSREGWDAAFGVTLAAMLVISPLAWVYYLTLLVVPLIIGLRSGSLAVRLLVSAGWLLCSVPFNQAPLAELSTMDIVSFQGGFAAFGLLAFTAGMLVLARELRAPTGSTALPQLRRVGSGSSTVLAEARSATRNAHA